MGTRYTDHVTPLYPQKLALTSPTGGGRSVGIVRVRTKATEFSFSLLSASARYFSIQNFEAIFVQESECFENNKESRIILRKSESLCLTLYPPVPQIFYGHMTKYSNFL